MKINCVIVDDEPLAHSILREYMKDIPAIHIIGSFYNAIDARKFLKEQNVDLIFLDVKMPEEDGMTFLKTLPVKPLTILITATASHALEAYDLDVLDYLVKPMRPERFRKAVDKAIEFFQLRQHEFVMADEKKPENRYLSLKSGREKIQVAIKTISHIQALKDYMLIYTPGKRHIVRSTVIKMLGRLPPEQFVRVHKSFIINKAMIRRVASSKIEIDGFTIPLGKLFKHSLLKDS
jgi:DNA-binding LytR/AlgR family response regulator